MTMTILLRTIHRKSRISVLSLLGLVASGCGGVNKTPMSNPPPACVPAASFEFAYLLTSVHGVNVSMYTVDSCTGVFTPTTPASMATDPKQFGSEEMVVDPLGRFAYVANLGSNATNQSTISMYTINSTSGVLTPNTPPTIPTGFFPQGIAIDPGGKFIYTANSDDNTVSMFAINQSTGGLMPTVPPTISTSASPGFLTVDPSGRFLYVSNQDSDAVAMFNVNGGTGVLSPMTPLTVPTNVSPFQVLVSPNGKFAYVTNAYSTPNTVSQYTIDANTGVLTPGMPPSAMTGNQPTGVAVDPSSRFAYVTNRVDNTVSMYNIDGSTGALSANGNAATIATGTEPFRILFDPTGKFLYVVNEGSAVSIYTVTSDGTLKAIGTTGDAGGALSLAMTMAKH